MATIEERLNSSILQVTALHIDKTLSSTELDLYESMKELSWKILFGIFLGVDSDDAHFSTTESLQEALLRGQFSLFPISLNTGFWHSPREKGIDAKSKLQTLFSAHFQESKDACPFSVANEDDLQDVANHSVLFTNSLAAKALASMLTALLLNLYLYKDADGRPLATSLVQEYNPERRAERLRSVSMETERLSPAIVRVMRRSTQDNLISSPDDQADIKVPKGWDCWLYFAGAGRDPSAFGPTWDEFDPARYLSEGVPRGIAFG
ncbi:hypothetical protein EK21DRAFT_106999 [Setomelanomma holmii]|uniref:Uncharacterized protein n=1 Tax=Setomelanomma holmii TaxID=210430 RepID=A0A9P4HJE0_9PLEO|nr:hypothetical protein EK21DRAFT_106999 [Setomelanomma holmii]